MKRISLYPIRYVARDTGLSPHVIRAWERRYGAVTPRRSNGNHRLYSAVDIERLRLLNRAVAGGHSISQVTKLPNAALEELLVRERRGRLPATPGTGPPQWRDEPGAGRETSLTDESPEKINPMKMSPEKVGSEKASQEKTSLGKTGPKKASPARATTICPTSSNRSDKRSSWTGASVRRAAGA